MFHSHPNRCRKVPEGTAVPSHFGGWNLPGEKRRKQDDLVFCFNQKFLKNHVVVMEYMNIYIYIHYMNNICLGAFFLRMLVYCHDVFNEPQNGPRWWKSNLNSLARQRGGSLPRLHRLTAVGSRFALLLLLFPILAEKIAFFSSLKLGEVKDVVKKGTT